MACVSSTSFAVLINGGPTKFFRCSRGLRHGFPLSHFLFILLMDGLRRLFEKEKYLDKILGVKVSIRVRITHLMFVDDVLLFGCGLISEWRDFHRILCLFSKATRLMINLDKYSFLSHAVDDEM